MIHYPLWRLLRRQVFPPARLRLTFLADTALKTLGRKGHLYGPGDQLTLLYVFHSNHTQPGREALLAARSLIYSKLIAKEELTDDLRVWPHLRDELSIIQIIRRLSLDDCRRLFPPVRRVGTTQAHQIVAEYLAGSKSHRRQKTKRIKPT